MIDIVMYAISTKKRPFAEWLDDLESKTQAVILKRLARVRLGNFGDCKYVQGGDGIYELRIDYGSGYRIYFGEEKSTVVVLLIGGDKKSQNRDIEKAKRYWLEYKGAIK
jgi:putative addiction module killer protein